jgi:peptidoglycan/LPS O-acetylase OafA/YrhL
MNKERNLYIDFTRGLCVLSVMFYHFNLNNFFAKNGLYGVIIFFIISGYCMSPSIESSKSLLDFIKKRFIRLYPALIICGVITTLVKCFFYTSSIQIHFNDLYKTILFLPNFNILYKFLQYLNLDIDTYNLIDGSYWSLIVEFKYYYLLAIVFFLINSKFYIQILTIFTFLSFFLLKYLTINNLHKPSILIDFVEYLPFFLIGISIYKLPDIKYYTILFLSLILFFIFYFFEIIPYSLPYSINEIVVVLIFIPWFYILKFNFIHIENKVIKLFAFLGRISYPLYLLHQEIGKNLLISLTRYFGHYLSILLVTTFLVIISFIIHIIIEKKLFNYLKKIS